MTDQSGKSPPVLKLVLASEKFGGRIIVGLEPFLEFNGWLHRELETLEDRWVHTAAPAAGRLSLFRRGEFGK